MAGVKTLADERIRLTILTTPPEDINAITDAELAAGIDASCQVAKNGSRFSAAASATFSDPALCEEDVEIFGSGTYEATITPFWYLNPEDGSYAEADNPVYEAVREKGTELTYVWRYGPRYEQPWADGDRYDAYIGISDNPQVPTETGGWIKRTVPVAVQRAALDKTVVTGGGGGA